MEDNYMLDKVLDKIKEIIGIEQFDDIKILIGTGDKLPDGIALKNVVILMTCFIKDDNKYCSRIFLERELFVKLACQKEIEPFLLIKRSIKCLIFSQPK